ncbi:histone-lysine N-methyltransferase SMYD3 isoform X1 [Neolamprologus brichardi]|uniref:histone-lysine N-methyltransferase SMYD3 isoform X1 n=1 Tax=Neolamprologus brichardi TaxID=32507 RepID=UPI0003EC0934|nr:histone-lysine N-methyltransferase SMYD3 isoform X1 [Neolamprologus brichardi]
MMALMLERFVSPGKGNGLRATGRIRKGELVISTEPLACCVSNRLAKEVCHHCFTRRESLLRCSQCKTARYCNTACQKQAWSGHKRECKCLQSLLPRLPTDSVCLAARLIFALLSPSKSSSEELYTLEEHESHLTSMPEQKKQGLSQLASMLELYLQQEVPDLLQEMGSALPPSCQEPLSLIAKVTCNCFTISDGELQEIGVGLYPSLSLLNHDCRPNCVMVFEGTKLELRAVRDIDPEDELTISYIETLSLTEDRQRQLEEQYHFTCHCQRCDSRDKDGLMLSGEEGKWRLLKEALPRLEGLKAESNWEMLLESCRHLLSSVGGEIPEENLYKLRITDMALDATVHLGRWEEAMSYGVTTLPAYRQYYPDPHPVHGIQLMRVGKLQHYLENIEDALDTFKQAYGIVKFTHGEDHPLMTELTMKMKECHSEMDHHSSSRH